MDRKKKALLGLVVGIISGLILVELVIALVDNTVSDLSELDWSIWVPIYTAFGVPIVTGLIQGLSDNEIWKILLFPIITGVIALVITVLVCCLIGLFISGDIFFAIVGILFLMALASPALNILVIFFE